jgi:L-ascorbate metabolism protein UlaG (beta-lactamase superfamily)
MKVIIKTLKMIGISIAGIIVLLLLVGVFFIYTSPQFGRKATAKELSSYTESKNFTKGKFENLGGVKMKSFSFGEYVDLTFKFFRKQPNAIPSGIVPVEKVDSLALANYSYEKPKIIWFGHSAVLIQIEGKTILLDPMFGDVPAPNDLLGKPRFNRELPIEIEKLPEIDAVIISHDHYDHLDYGSIVKLKNKVKAFYTPLGVGNHLEEWGVERTKITELDWWDEVQHEGLKFVCTPSQHFSGRGLTDGASTLWSSWIVQSKTDNIYFSGDSGYGNHFKQIGEKYGPFDFAMMECGQYNEMWSEIHMMPEQTVQASIDLGAKVMMPIHWASFKLALHPWSDPVKKTTKHAELLKLAITTPKIGEEIIVGQQGYYPVINWWEGI